MHSSLLALSLGLFLTAGHAQSLLDALRAANASAYANYLENNPQSLAFLSSSDVRTAFAPTDEAFLASTLGNATANVTASSRPGPRQGGGNIDPRILFMSATSQQTAAQARFGQGEPIFTNLQNSSGGSQPTVSGPSSAPAFAPSKLRRRQLGNSSTVSLFTGLGNTVNIVQEDTPYTGGLIQITNGLFTIPQSFASTFSQTNLTSFSSGLQTANLGSVLDAQVGMTVFSTTNEAFQAGLGNVTSSARLSSTLSNHIIPNFQGYLPLLSNGLILTTQAGTTVTVSVQKGDYYLNNARVVGSNLITSNGVSYVLDAIIVPNPAPFQGAGVSSYQGKCMATVYNSAIVPSLSANLYVWVAVKPEFLTGASWNVSGTSRFQRHQPHNFSLTNFEQCWNDSALPISPTVQSMQASADSYTKLNTLDCLLTYTNVFGNRSNVILVTSDASAANNSGNSLLAYGSQPRNQWLVGKYVTWGSNTFNANRLEVSYFPGGAAQQAQTIADWNVGGFKIDYCLSSQTTNDQGQCSVDYSFSVMIIVCVFNFFKALCICCTAFIFSRSEEHSLVVLGDAIGSFLANPDNHTKGMSIASKDQISIGGARWETPKPLKWQTSHRRWWDAASSRQWRLYIGLFAFWIFMGFAALGWTIYALPREGYHLSFQSLVNSGFGKVQPSAFAWVIHGLNNKPTFLHYLNLMLGNLWQFYISILYLLVNNLVTTFLLAAEWDGYIKHKKTLRVSHPRGIQRSSFSLSMPWKYGIPLVGSMALWHFCVSQSIFVTRLSQYLSNGEISLGTEWISSIYSTNAVIVSLIIAIIIITAVLLNGRRVYGHGMPLASSCSAAISAACHRPDYDVEAHLFPIKYGVVSVDDAGVGHCSFTTASDVENPCPESQTERTRYFVSSKLYA